MTWWETVPTFLAVLTFGLVPGLLLSVILGLRGMALVGSAPAFSVTSIALASILAPLIGLDWGILPVALTTLILAVIVAAFRILWHRLRPHPPIPQDSSRLMLWAGIGVVFAALAIGIRFIVIFWDPENISQTYDNIFHLNALRFVLDTENASSLSLGGLPFEDPGNGSFYPAVWHALTTLIIETTGVSIPVAVNLVSILMGAIYWPLGCVFLVRQVAGPRAIAMVAAGGLAAAFGAFPYTMIDFGVLYPYMLGISLAPAALAYVVLALRVGIQPTMRPSRARLALLGVAPGVALAHPSVIMGILALSVPIILTVIYRTWDRLRIEQAPRHRFAWLFGVSAAVFIVLAILWLVLRVNVAWVPSITLAQSIGEALLNAPVDLPVSVLVTAVMVVGIVIVSRQPTRWWLLGSYAMAAFLYVASAGFDGSWFRSGITGIWYGDSYRLAALLPVTVLPLAVIGFVKVYDVVLARVRSHATVTPARSNAYSIAFVALALLASQGFSVQAATIEATENYHVSEDSPLLTPDELDVLEHVDDYVPEDAVVAGNPWNGSGLVYALSDRRAMLPHVGGFDTLETQLLAERLRYAETNPDVCAAAEALGVEYVLDFGPQEVHGGHHDFWGFNHLENSTAVEPVYQKGDVGLYKLTACD